MSGSEGPLEAGKVELDRTTLETELRMPYKRELRGKVDHARLEDT